jgi:hypothetical protein
MSYSSRNPQFASTVLDDIAAATPSNPPASKHKIVDRNGVLFIRDSAGTESVVSNGQTYPGQARNYTLTGTVSGHALTISLKTAAGADPSAGDPVPIAFRNATLATGDYSVVSATAATSVVVSSGSTLGTANAVAATLCVYAINNAGTVVLAVSNGFFDDNSIQSATAEGGAGAADSAATLYATATQTNKAIRWLGRIQITEATAGTWDTAPSSINLFPGFNVATTANPTGLYQAGTVPGGPGTAAAAGYIGEKTTATIGNSAAMSTGITINAATLTLNKGSYVVYGKPYFELTAAVTSISYRRACISLTSATSDNATETQDGTPAGQDAAFSVLPFYVDIPADNTPVYLVAYSSFVVGTGGMRINGAHSAFYAVRVR